MPFIMNMNLQRAMSFVYGLSRQRIDEETVPLEPREQAPGVETPLALFLVAKLFEENPQELDKAIRVWGVLVQHEMERGRSPLVSIPPFGRGFSRHEGLSIRCDLFEKRRSEAAALRSSSR
jgi:hypothetical protein